MTDIRSIPAPEKQRRREIETRRLERVRKATLTEPLARWVPLDADTSVQASSYDANGNYRGMLCLDGPYYKISQSRDRRGNVRWVTKRVRRPRPTPRPRTACPTRTRSSRARAKALTRSSSNAGDSGDPDGDQESPPWKSKGVAATLEQDLRNILPQPEERHCKCGCGWSLAGKNRQAKYYDDTHRQRGWRGSSQ